MTRSLTLTLTFALLALTPGCSKKSSAPASAGQEATAAQAPPSPKPAEEAAPVDEMEKKSEHSEAAGAEARRAPGASAAPDAALADNDQPLGSRVQIAEPMINGGLHRDIIRRKAQDSEADLLACHAASLENNPDLFGTLAIEIAIDKRGVVQDVEVGDDSELDERVLIDCVTALVSGWSFAGDATDKATVELSIDLLRPE